MISTPFYCESCNALFAAHHKYERYCELCEKIRQDSEQAAQDQENRDREEYLELYEGKEPDDE